MDWITLTNFLLASSDDFSMKRTVILGTLCTWLMLATGTAMFIQASTGGSSIYLDCGLGFEPRDVGNTTLLLAMLLMPFWWASRRAGQENRRSRFTPAASFVVLLAFPLPIEFTIWSEASDSDGEPIFNEWPLSRTRAKSSDQYFGYSPFWQRVKEKPDPAFDRYETTALTRRYEYKGNILWSHTRVWGLHRYGWKETEDSHPGKTNECILDQTFSVFGLYWRDMRNEALQSLTDAELPKDQCHLIVTPKVASETYRP